MRIKALILNFNSTAMRNYVCNLVIFLCFVSCRPDPMVQVIAKWEAQANNVTIHRDNFGVPHIYGKTDADAVFGFMYAQCEDDFPRVERNYIWAIGRLAEVEGSDALYSDLRARLFMTLEEAKEEYEKCPAWLKKLCVAWADGINYYLHTHPEVSPKLLTHFEPWMPMYFSEGSIGGDIERVSTKRIQSFYESGADLSSVSAPIIDERMDEEPAGSNGFAISGQHTKSGDAMLLINPHTSFYFRGEVHVVSEEGLNAYGAVTWGQFFVYQGFNEKTGWMHTSTYTDVIDEFKEVIVEKEGKKIYKYGDEWRDVLTSEITLKYKEGDQLNEQTFPLYHTHHGPITHKIDRQWVATGLMWTPAKALEQSYTRTKLDGHESFYKMMEMNTNSSNNTVYADAQGNIAYYHGNFIPIRDTRYDYMKPVDGSNPKTDWKGLHPVEEAITVINPEIGWIQNCNSTPFTSAGKNSPKRMDYPRYMSIDRENFRGIHAIRLLSKMSDMTLDKLIEMAYDPHLPAFEKLIPGLVQAYDNNQDKDPRLKGPINALRNWDFKTDVTSIPMTLAHYYGMICRAEGMVPDNITGIHRLNYMGTRADELERLTLFGKVVNRLNDDFGTWEMPWGAINRFQRLNGDINMTFDDSKESIPIGMASGRWGALAAYGQRGKKTTKKIYGTRGNSFVAVVEFGDKVKAKSVLAGGQSGDPSSPHFYDQAQRYADIKFKDVPYYKEDVDAVTQRSYHPGMTEATPSSN